MLTVILAVILLVIAMLLMIFFYGYLKGKKAEQNKQIRKGYMDAIETTKRRHKRDIDDINTVRKRMHEFTRDR